MKVAYQGYTAPPQSSMDVFMGQVEKSPQQQIQDFENALQTLISQPVLGLNSGTSALHMALVLLEVQPGDKVICSDLTFVASANPIKYVGAEVVLVDSEPKSWNMDPYCLEQAILECLKAGSKPRAVILVHLYGVPADILAIKSLCKQYDIPLIEDAAHALGSTYENKQVGTFGDFGVISFNNNKLITGMGGGILTSPNPELITKGKYLATQAKEPKNYYHHTDIGYNYRISALNASMALANLSNLTSSLRRGTYLATALSNQLSDYLGVSCQSSSEVGKPNFWRIGIKLDNEEKLKIVSDKIVDLGVPCYRSMQPLSNMPLFRNAKFFGNQVGDVVFKQGLVLSGNLYQDAVQAIAEVCGKYLQKR